MFYLTDNDTETDDLDMKLHTDKIHMNDVYNAATAAGPMVSVGAGLAGSRSRSHAFNVTLTGTSSRRPNSGQTGAGDDYAATWDEWGMFFAHLYEIDPQMKCWAYDDADDFHFKTAARFRALLPSQQCKNHKWDYQGTAATAAYHVYTCRKCEALKRH